MSHSQRCVSCNLTLNSTVQFEQHMTGKAHAKKLKKLTESGQVLCYPGPSPIKKINFVPAGMEQAGQPPLAAGTATGTEAGNSQPGGCTEDTYCQLCLVTLNSAEQARIHYSGTKHLRKLKVSRQYYKEVTSAPGPENGVNHGSFFCGFCNIRVNSASQMDFHREGSRHKRMVEGMKRQIEDPNHSQGPPAKRAATATEPTNSVQPPRITPSFASFNEVPLHPVPMQLLQVSETAMTSLVTAHQW